MIAAVVLAAGGSTRLGRPKQLVEIAGQNLVRRAVEACIDAGCSPVVATVGHAADHVRNALADTTVTIVENPGWREGISASIRAGVGVLDLQTRAVVLTVCDQSALSAAVIRRLVEAWDGTPQAMVACAYANTLGVPALFGRAWFAKLATLQGDRGAKGLLEAHHEHVRRLDWPAGARDIDAPSELPSSS